MNKKKFYELIRLNPHQSWRETAFGKMTAAERKRAQVKGGLTVSKDTKHMKEIGRLGGKHGGGPHRKKGTPYAHPDIAALIAEQRRFLKQRMK